MTRNNAAKALIDPGDLTTPDHRHPGVENLLPPWQPGKSGNPAGRPKGARSKLSEQVIAALLDSFEREGASTIEEVRKKNPSHYLAAIVSLLPKQQEKVDSPFADLTDDELAQLELWLAASRAKNVTIDANATSTTQESSSWTEPEPQS